MLTICYPWLRSSAWVVVYQFETSSWRFLTLLPERGTTFRLRYVAPLGAEATSHPWVAFYNLADCCSLGERWRFQQPEAERAVSARNPASFSAESELTIMAAALISAHTEMAASKDSSPCVRFHKANNGYNFATETNMAAVRGIKRTKCTIGTSMLLLS